ncbi:transcriptional regulator BetI [Acinetobacter larvae]|uniref:HTH-type transcriptional regulator BetI n=1 Tax=Acinetobacter larvae TaxID=1789224 RepID=A0A1B2M120_9GAMM|nr:transcriptional regulator BetI [Acinetobacter larvae]AOA58713.1 transcriptional regulator BetI [Acinetobacter larvae]
MLNKSRVKPEHIRREEIMQAAFQVVHDQGLTNMTIAKIAKQAGLSTGIVSHYFGDKQGLINACMLEMLNILRQKTEQYKAEYADTPVEQIKAIIDSNFDVTQVNKISMRLWLDFWSASMHMPELHRLQRINDQRLKSNLRHHLLQLVSAEQAERGAFGLAALIDGLWLRGSLIGSAVEKFDIEQARDVAYHYLDMLINNAQHRSA